MSLAQSLNRSCGDQPMTTIVSSKAISVDGRFITATPVGVAVGSALVGAAWTGAQVGDAAD